MVSLMTQKTLQEEMPWEENDMFIYDLYKVQDVDETHTGGDR